MKIVGSWKHRDGVPKPRQVQTMLGGLLGEVEALPGDRAETLRHLWQAVIDDDNAVVVRVGINGCAENLVSVSLTSEMFETIETARGNIPRGTFLRALTKAGLWIEKESNEVE